MKGDQCQVVACRIVQYGQGGIARNCIQVSTTAPVLYMDGQGEKFFVVVVSL